MSFDLLTFKAQFQGYGRASPDIDLLNVQKEELGYYGYWCCYQCGSLLPDEGAGWPLWLSRPTIVEGYNDINFCSLPCLLNHCVDNTIGEEFGWYTFNYDGSVAEISKYDWVSPLITAFNRSG